MEENIKLKAEKRELLGSKVKKLRNRGILPANIYGPNVESLAIKMSTDDFIEAFEQAGETELIYLQITGEKKERPVLVREIQIHPVTNRIFHADFAQIDLTEKTNAEVPLEFINESPAVKEGEGILLELMTDIEVRSLPTEIPSVIEVDISSLKSVDDSITVEELNLPEEIEVEAAPDELVCKIEKPKMEELEEEVEEEILPEELVEEEVPEGEEIPPAEEVEASPKEPSEE